VVNATATITALPGTCESMLVMAPMAVSSAVMKHSI
jgi:hypothetical protein